MFIATPCFKSTSKIQIHSQRILNAPTTSSITKQTHTKTSATTTKHITAKGTTNQQIIRNQSTGNKTNTHLLQILQLHINNNHLIIADQIKQAQLR